MLIVIGPKYKCEINVEICSRGWEADKRGTLDLEIKRRGRLEGGKGTG